jgi:hypothetical protein
VPVHALALPLSKPSLKIIVGCDWAVMVPELGMVTPTVLDAVVGESATSTKRTEIKANIEKSFVCLNRLKAVSPRPTLLIRHQIFLLGPLYLFSYVFMLFSYTEIVEEEYKYCVVRYAMTRRHKTLLEYR